MEPSTFLQGGTVSVSTETYAVCRTDQPHPSAFASVQDGSETDLLDTVDPTAVEGEWNRLTFEMDLPFELVGFLSTVATALADAGVAVFVISSFATDHVFVKAADIPVAVSELEELGCRVERADQRESPSADS
jgi:Uncharacterized conserved protein